MNVRQLELSRRTIAVAAALIGTVSLVIGAHAALNMRAIDAAKAVATDEVTGSIGQSSRLALVIGNGHYPDASAPLTQSITTPARCPRRSARTALTSIWWKTRPRTTWSAPSTA